MSGELLYRAPRPHCCRVPEEIPPKGSIWRCQCGRYWWTKPIDNGWTYYHWMPLTAWRARRRLRKAGLEIAPTGV